MGGIRPEPTGEGHAIMWPVTRGRAARRVALGVVTAGLLAVPMTVLTARVAGAAQRVTTCSGSPSARGSLPFEVARARSGQKIHVATSCPASAPIELSAPLSIDTDLDISGPGAASLVLSGGNSSGVIDVGVSGTLELSGVTLEDGSAADGGAIHNEGTLTVDDSTLSGNSASSGGGIDNDGTVTVDDSTLSGNHAEFGGALLNFGAATVENSTLSGNTATQAGGALLNEGTSTVAVSTVSDNAVDAGGGGGGGIFNGSSLVVSTSTVADNTAPAEGGGIFNTGGAMTTVAGTIVAGSSSGDCAGTTTDAGYNLSDDATCDFTAGQHSLSDTDPDLGPLADNGGTTATQLPGPTSPALDQIPLNTFVDGIVLCPGTDQRGVERPQAVGCDIGAVEPVLPAAITSADRATAAVASPFSFTVTTSGTPTPKVSISGTLPKGIHFVNQFRTALIYGTATSNAPGVYSIVITATFRSRSSTQTATQDFTLTVVNG